MSPLEAITECRRLHPVEGARWPTPLLACLDDPVNERPVFEWLTSCVGDVLDHLVANTEELQGSLRMARRSAIEGVDSEAIEAKAWELWHRRGEEPARIAVAQLFFGILAYRQRKKYYLQSCAVPLVVLDRSANDRGEILERVVMSFAEYVERSRPLRTRTDNGDPRHNPHDASC